MKKLLLITTLLLCVVATAKAQGIVYQPFIRPSSPAPVWVPPPIPPSYAPAQPQTHKTKEEILPIVAYSIRYDKLMDIRVRETSYSDGSVIHKVIGIKGIMGQWESTEYDLQSISFLLSQNQGTKDVHDFMLELSGYGTHIATFTDTKGSEILLVGLKEDISTPPVPLTNQEVSIVMNIDNAIIDGVDQTRIYKEWGTKLYVYTNESNGRTMFANKGNSSQSYGFVYDHSFETIGSGGVMKGIWEYHNTYDNNTGSLRMSIHFNGETDQYELNLISPDLKTMLNFRGYVESPTSQSQQQQPQRQSPPQNRLRKDPNFKIE